MSAVRVSLLHQGSSLRSSRAPRLTAGALRSCLRPALGPGYAGRATRAREPRRRESAGTSSASGGGAQTPGWVGALFAGAGEFVVSVVGSHPDHLRPRQSRAVAAQGVKVVRTVARSTLTP